MSSREMINDAIARSGIHLTAPVSGAQADVLSPSALRFVAALTREFSAERDRLLRERSERQRLIESGETPRFLERTAHVREAKWSVSPIPKDLVNRRVEITGPTDRKTILAALNSGANVFVADFEDSNAPTWHNVAQGQLNLRAAIDGTLTIAAPAGKEQTLGHSLATIAVRPRGLHLVESHVIVDGDPVPAAFFDFGVHFFNNARTLLEAGTAPYFYLTKLESHPEARLWNDVFNMAQDALGIPRGTIRATVCIETVTAAFEMDEILFELRHHSSGLSYGRWDYIFSFIRAFRDRPEFVLPDRDRVTTDLHFLVSLAKLLIRTCHRRNIHAIGGMTAQQPITADPLANAAVMQHVRDDKLREVTTGHDGTRVAHPDLVPVAREVFDAHMEGANQIDNLLNGVTIRVEDLLRVPEGEITERGLRHNIDVVVVYLESWLRGKGRVPVSRLIEDAATTEISRSQIWQWVRHRAKLDDGRAVNDELVRQLASEQLCAIREKIGDERYEAGRYGAATEIFERLTLGNEFPDFMTAIAYRYLDESEQGEA